MTSPPPPSSPTKGEEVRRIIVIGGGITGLAAAWKLRQSFQRSGEEIHLQLLEASPHIGGSLKSATRDGFLLEMGPDCFITDKPRGVGLCRELGLDEDLIGTRPESRRSFILRDGRFFPIPEGFYLLGPSRPRPFLESGLLSWPGKFRAMLEPLLPGRPQTDESLGSFVRRRFGQELLDWMAEPLVAGIYGADPEDLSLRATFPQFLEMERTYGSVVLGLRKRPKSTRAASGARYSLFATLRGGLQTLPDTIAGKLGTDIIRQQAKVTRVVKGPEAGLWKIHLASGEIIAADAVCLALPAYAGAELLRPVDSELSADLEGIPYAPAATINFAFRLSDIKRPLDGVGFVVPHKENRLVLGCTFAHRKFEGRAPEGDALVRAFLGGSQGPLWIGEGDAALATKVLGELTEWLGIEGQPRWSHLERHGRALPLYSIGHLPRQLRIEERLLSHNGLALAGNWQYGVGIPDCIAAGERAAESLLTYLERPAPAFS